MSELLGNLSLKALNKGHLNVELDFAEISGKTKEIDRSRKRKAVENKKAIKRAVDFVEEEVKETVTDIIPQFPDFLIYITDRLESIVGLIKEDKILDLPMNCLICLKPSKKYRKIGRMFPNISLEIHEQDLKTTSKLEA